MSVGEGCDAGGSGHPWGLTALPRNLIFCIAQLDRTLHGLDGVAHVLRAGLAAQTQGAAKANETLSGNITDKLLVALSELIDRANGDVHFIAEVYPARAPNEACVARGDG